MEKGIGTQVWHWLGDNVVRTWQDWHFGIRLLDVTVFLISTLKVSALMFTLVGVKLGSRM